MDEPIASLDFGNQVRVLSEIKILAKRGIAVILSTHDPDQAFVCALARGDPAPGRLADAGPPEDVITAAVLHAVYGVEVEKSLRSRAPLETGIRLPAIVRKSSLRIKLRR